MLELGLIASIAAVQHAVYGRTFPIVCTSALATTTNGITSYLGDNFDLEAVDFCLLP
jgi:hypothetical protein